MSDIVWLEKSDISSTLTTWIFCAFWQMYSAEKIGLRSYINWPRFPAGLALRNHLDDKKFAECPNMYSWYFEQPMLRDGEAGPRDLATLWEWEKPRQEYAESLNRNPLYGSVSQIKDFYRKHLKLNSTVNARGEALVKKYGIDFSKTIGVTWRGTDSIIDGRPRMPIQTYFPWIDDILEKEPGLRIMCTAEEEGILDPLLARYPQAFKIEEFFMTPQGKQQLGDNPERFSTLSGFERGMQPALMVYLFSKCAHYIKNRSSTGAVASWLSSGRIVCLAHPENMGHGFDVTKAEVSGEIFPLNR